MKNKKINAPTASDDNHEIYVLGCQFYNASKFNKAITVFKNALEYWPEDDAAWWALGNCYTDTNRPRKAEQCFRKAITYATSEYHDAIYFNLTNSLYDQGFLNDAIDVYEKISAGSEIGRKAQRNLLLTRSKL